MQAGDGLRRWFDNLRERSVALLYRVAEWYRPSTLRERGVVWASGLLIITWLLVSVVLGIFWSRQPDAFDVQQVALQRIGAERSKAVTGEVYTSTLLKIGETLLDKPGGYLSNDIAPPGIWLDNMPNWEYGALVMLRDGVAALRNNFSRSQSQSTEDRALSEAEPRLNFRNDAWILPSTEREYRRGLKQLDDYLQRLSNPEQKQAQFYTRADNLRKYLEVVEKRLGSLSQRLSASVGQLRVNTDLAGDSAAQQSTAVEGAVEVKTPWLELDDVFYEARGATWALRALLQSVAYDFGSVLKKKNALISLRQIIRELDESQQTVFSPVILNGSGFGIFANYSLTMANYVSRANAAVIDLRNLLQQG